MRIKSGKYHSDMFAIRDDAVSNRMHRERESRRWRFRNLLQARA